MNGARERARIGVLGGTFNPIHLGHLRAAEEAVEALELERVLFVPSARPPHKSPGDEVIAPADQRLEWVRLAIRDNPRFAVDAIEVARAGPSYLLETLRELSTRFGRLVFLLGRDAFTEMATWREPDVLLTLADFAVLSRPPVREGSLREWLPDALAGALEFLPDGRSAVHRSAGTRVLLVEITALDVSASEIRARLREGLSVRYLLPEPVHEAIAASRAYRGSGVGG
jgi:nicotinate-nucleotide adenylyltransferase